VDFLLLKLFLAPLLVVASALAGRRWGPAAAGVLVGLPIVADSVHHHRAGPELLAPFPIATSVLAAFVHVQHESAMTARALVGVLMCLFGFAAFRLTLAVLARPLGAATFAIVVAVTVVVQLLVIVARSGPASTVTGPGRAHSRS
jgi:hypothetical protein